ncbi:type II toxin-antitoxin system CcdA family antitoxin, partial [Streptosporangium algeriense]
MPKINVYLPDELAEAVRAAGVPVSAVCQRALEQAVRRITAIRETGLGSPGLDGSGTRFANFTSRARTAVGLALDEARAAG